MSDNRGQWASKFGFIMAAAGSAVGLGNIWRFPYLTGQNGGAAFVVVYILCVVVVGAPMLMNEMALGRLTGKNAIGAFRETGGNIFWTLAGGVLAIAVSFFVLSYYTVIAGWTVGYIFTSITNSPIPFKEFIATPSYVMPLFGLAMLSTIIIVLGGISGGIEKATKIMMPLLFLLLLVTIIRSLTLDGAGAGVSYYLVPDFSKINGTTVLKALTQSFFSLGVGWGIMITYGSYLPKNQSIVSSSLWVGAMDTSVALLAGLMVFPAVFAFGMQPNQGPTLVFEVLANIFPRMPFGNIAGAFFFLLLFIAAITSTISMVEVVGAWLIDSKKWNRKKATWTVGIAAFVVGTPAALSNGSSEFFSNMQLFGHTGLLDIMDHIFGTVCMLIVVLVTCLYSGWVFQTNKIIDEINEGSPYFKTTALAGIWKFFLQFICPVIIIIVVLSVTGVMG
ncbi:MAG TPA: sodium-dependent transporter [Cyclobacteriaceae bacterium]|nr:sodium-dependent transporter [Cyclobacteriaceae bacterium]